MVLIQTCNNLFLLLEIKLIKKSVDSGGICSSEHKRIYPHPLLFSWYFYFMFFPYFIDWVLILISKHFLPFCPLNFSNCCLLLCSSNTYPSLWIYPPLFPAKTYWFSPSICQHALSFDIHFECLWSFLLVPSNLLHFALPGSRVLDGGVHGAQEVFSLLASPTGHMVGYFTVANSRWDYLKACALSPDNLYRIPPTDQTLPISDRYSLNICKHILKI